MKSRFKRAMLLMEMFFGHSASQARVFVQLPNPSSSILESIAFARRAASTLPCGSRFSWLTLADTNVDPVGACVGMNGARVNAVVQELRGEKIDIINWDENPALLIENSLSPAKVISVMADPEEKIASVIVPDYQLSLAIGKEGQNARLAARLTGYKIDIKSETQAIEAGELPENYMEEMGLVGEEGYTGDYEEEYNEEYSEESYDEAAEDQNEESEEIEFIETENE